ncbi:MAG: sugar transferase [Gammaproteobacteria bacterium]|nr:sugar transferase [Gammaproteobacteria bacterium]
MIRRLVDIVLASIGLVVSLPVLVVAAGAIYAANPGPVIYRAARVGRTGRVFTMFKLRTMYLHRGESGSVVTAAADGRVFPLGRLLRRSKIDEVPQMVNIIMGDMSIVGPRPRDPKIVARYTALHRETLKVLPGLTSPGTLFYVTHGESTLRSRDPEMEYRARILPQKLALDIDYVRNRSVWIDLLIVVRTVGAIFNLDSVGLSQRHVDRVGELVQPAKNTDGETDPRQRAPTGGQSQEWKNGGQEDLRDR